MSAQWECRDSETKAYGNEADHVLCCEIMQGKTLYASGDEPHGNSGCNIFGQCCGKALQIRERWQDAPYVRVVSKPPVCIVSTGDDELQGTQLGPISQEVG